MKWRFGSVQFGLLGLLGLFGSEKICGLVRFSKWPVRSTTRRKRNERGHSRGRRPARRYSVQAAAAADATQITWPKLNVAMRALRKCGRHHIMFLLLLPPPLLWLFPLLNINRTRSLLLLFDLISRCCTLLAALLP
jgi:hypothetical protein